mmetsp:Transcript_88469/g.140770  ORF Transcript_88469/g.140770 Transcript_88469/m.140770 type:complete len:216 (-) Transcript_88469:48-695(-)
MTNEDVFAVLFEDGCPVAHLLDLKSFAANEEAPGPVFPLHQTRVGLADPFAAIVQGAIPRVILFVAPTHAILGVHQFQRAIAAGVLVLLVTFHHFIGDGIKSTVFSFFEGDDVRQAHGHQLLVGWRSLSGLQLNGQLLFRIIIGDITEDVPLIHVTDLRSGLRHCRSIFLLIRASEELRFIRHRLLSFFIAGPKEPLHVGLILPEKFLHVISSVG